MESEKVMLRHILDNGTEKDDRTGKGTHSVFGYLQRYSLEGTFPAGTLRRIPFMASVHEMVWIVSGSGRLKYLIDNGVTFWNKWVKPGTEVWGRELSLEEREAIFNRQCQDEDIDKAELRLYKDEHCVLKENQAGVPLVPMLDHFKIPTYELLDGDLGAVYGVQWRNIVDTRLVETEAEVEALKGRGFKCLGGMEPLGEDYCTHFVVQRKIDQLANAIELLKNNPDDRGIIINAWHVPALDEMALRPCHTLFQFNTRKRGWEDVLNDIAFSEDDFMIGHEFEESVKHMRSSEPQYGFLPAANGGSGFRHPDYYQAIYDFAEEHGIATRYLDCMLTMRSNDAPIGRPFNIIGYSVLTMVLAQIVGMVPGEFVLSNGDLHIYKNQVDAVNKMLARDPMQPGRVMVNPKLINIDDFVASDVRLVGYESHPAINIPVAK
jgi:thymidylate synthase